MRDIIWIMKRIIFLIFAVIVIASALFYYFKIIKKAHSGSISVSGNIEATETRLSFQVAGKIKELYVDEGNYVKKGQPVATLDR